MKRSRAFTAWIILLSALCLCGLALIFWGATHQGSCFPAPPMLITPQVRHG